MTTFHTLDGVTQADAFLRGRFTYQAFAARRPRGDDVPAGVAGLKARSGGELRVHGSAGLVQTLLCHRLVDEAAAG